MPKSSLTETGRRYYDYYLAGGHWYEFPRGVGKRRAKVCFAETPTGDGEMLHEENNGLRCYTAYITNGL